MNQKIHADIANVYPDTAGSEPGYPACILIFRLVTLQINQVYILLYLSIVLSFVVRGSL